MEKPRIHFNGDPDAFRPLWFTLHEQSISLLKPNDTLQYTFTMAAQNVTGAKIEAGHENLHVMYYFADSKSSASDFDGVPTPDIPERNHPAIAKNEIVTLKNVVHAGGSYRAPLLYILRCSQNDQNAAGMDKRIVSCDWQGREIPQFAQVPPYLPPA